MNAGQYDQYGNRAQYFGVNPNNYQSPSSSSPHQQNQSTQQNQPSEFSSILGSINHELLDDFQIQLFQLIQNANDQSISSYFQKKANILYRFIITLYIASLDKTNPIRKNNNDELDLFNEFQNEFQNIIQHNESFSVGSNVSHSNSSYYNHGGHGSNVSNNLFNITHNNNNNNNINELKTHSSPVTPTTKTQKRPDESPSFGPNIGTVHPPPVLMYSSNANNNNNNNMNQFQAPNTNTITFDVSTNALPPSRQRAGSPRSNWQQNYNQIGGVKSTPNFAVKPKQNKDQQNKPKKRNNDNNNNNNILSAPIPNTNRRETFSKMAKSKSAQVLKNVVNKKKRKKKVLPNISEDEEEKEKTLFIGAAEIIAPMTIVRGKIRVTNRSIAFVPDSKQPENMKGGTHSINLALHPPELERMKSVSFLGANKKYREGIGKDDKYWVAVNVASSYEQVGGTRYKLMNAKNVWKIDMVTEIYYRRYQARNIAFELFFNDDTSWLFNVFDRKLRNQCFDAIIDLKPCNLIDDPITFKNPKKAIKSSKIHHRWCTREISNFEYIMRINLLAGRTFNDLEQYPVVPWIIKDYESTSIDLKNPKIYRDLTKPIGAQNADRLSKFVERYELMTDDPDNRFMYGTHYSTKAIVLYYLIRMEPFTTYNKLFQGGKFDTADRLFNCINKTFRGCMKSTSDVKELIPEFYYMTDFLENKSNLDLGITQNGNQRVNHVILPKWSGGSYETFTKIMRNAFESEYVSRNLHHWIDLIFGYKQTGKAAESAFNVFHPYTYQDNIDLDKIENDTEKEVILQIISEFGQTPTQIFKKAHRVRLKGTQVVQNIFKAKSIKYYGSFLCTESQSGHLGISYIAIRGKNVITISTDNTVDVHKFDSKSLQIIHKSDNKSSLNVLSSFNRNRIKPKNKFLPNIGGVSSIGNVKNQIIKKVSNQLFLANLLFAVTMNGNYLFAAGFEDYSFIQYNITNQRIEEQFNNHSNIVSCLALDENERKNKLILVSGSYDKSIIVWKGKKNKKKHNRSISANYYGLNKDQQTLELSMIYTKTKHDSEINCIDISVEKGVIIVGTRYGSIYMYNSSKGDKLWKTQTNNNDNIAICKVSKTFGTVLCYSCNYDQNPAKLYLFSNNGQLLNQYIIPNNDKYHEILFSKSGNNACCGGLNKSIVIYNLPTFHVGRQLNDSNDVIRHIVTDKDEKYILSGLSNGNVLLYSFPESAQKITPKLPHRKSLYGVAGNQKKTSPFQLKQ